MKLDYSSKTFKANSRHAEKNLRYLVFFKSEDGLQIKYETNDCFPELYILRINIK